MQMLKITVFRQFSKFIKKISRMRILFKKIVLVISEKILLKKLNFIYLNEKLRVLKWKKSLIRVLKE